MSAFIAELIGFVLFIGLIRWKITPRVGPLLDRRRETIRASIDGAASIRSSAEAEAERRKELLVEAHTEADAILEQARATANEIEEEGRRKAAEDYERLLNDARAEVELERQRARDEVAAEIGSVVVNAAEKVVRAEIDAKLQSALVGEVIAAAESSRVGV
jgi:F-type H+-transporting ATPase subunit b